MVGATGRPLTVLRLLAFIESMSDPSITCTAPPGISVQDLGAIAARFFANPFEKFVGKDVPNIWRWLHTNPVSLDTSRSYGVRPGAMNVPTWLRGLRNS